MSPSSLPIPAVERGVRPLRRFLVVLSLLTLAATIEKAVGLSAPMPLAEAPSSLRLAGYRVRALASEPLQQGREMSQGTLRRFQLTPLTGGPEMTLTLLPVRSRTGTDLSAETFGGKGLSLDSVAAVVPDFTLNDQRLVSLPLPRTAPSAPRSDQVAIGRGPTDPAGSLTRLQTCLTGSGQAAVKATTLAGHTQPSTTTGTPPVPLGRLLRAAGLASPRHECLAVQLQTDAAAGRIKEGNLNAPNAPDGGPFDGDPQARLETAWRDLRGVLIHVGTVEEMKNVSGI